MVDGTIVKLDGIRWEVFAPRWYRLDRWVLWFVLLVSACPRRFIEFTSIERAPAVYPWEASRLHIARRKFRAFEV